MNKNISKGDRTPLWIMPQVKTWTQNTITSNDMKKKGEKKRKTQIISTWNGTMNNNTNKSWRIAPL